MTKKGKIDTTLILDRSGSMDAAKDDTIGGFNRFLSEAKKFPDTTFTLVLFDDQYEVPFDTKPISEQPELTAETFVPRGRTALYDAIGRTINSIGARLASLPEDERPEKVVVVILTDGLENMSKEFTAEKIKEMITHQQDSYKWEFSFLGANQDAILSARTMGIKTSSALTYRAKNVGATMDCMTVNYSSFVGAKAASMSYSEDDRKKATL